MSRLEKRLRIISLFLRRVIVPRMCTPSVKNSSVKRRPAAEHLSAICTPLIKKTLLYFHSLFLRSLFSPSRKFSCKCEVHCARSFAFIIDLRNNKIAVKHLSTLSFNDAYLRDVFTALITSYTSISCKMYRKPREAHVKKYFFQFQLLSTRNKII